MRYTGIQPQYFPRLHYFARILNTDHFVLRDDAQFVSKHRYPDGRNDKSYQAHTSIKQAQGAQLLAIPIKHSGLTKIAETKISYDQSWNESHLKTIGYSYAKAKNFSQLYPEIESILNKKYETIAELNLATTLWGVLKLLGHEKVQIADLTIDNVSNQLKRSEFRLSNIHHANKFPIQTEGLTANEKIVAFCKLLGTTEDYCGGTGASAYMDEEIFAKNGIKINVQDWKCQPYQQLFQKEQGFIPNLSILDLLMNASNDEAVRIIRG